MVTISKSHNNKATSITLGDTTLLFSYETLVAYRVGYGCWVVSENVWGPTTGRHIMGETGVEPADRVPRTEFIALAAARFDA